MGETVVGNGSTESRLKSYVGKSAECSVSVDLRRDKGQSSETKRLWLCFGNEGSFLGCDRDGRMSSPEKITVWVMSFLQV